MSYAANAYARTARVAMTPREAESAVLIKAARKLQAVHDDFANQAGALSEALTFNQKVWTLLATGATDVASGLPADVQQGMTRLAVFVFRRIIDTLAEPSADKLPALIAINHNLAAGLAAR